MARAAAGVPGASRLKLSRNPTPVQNRAAWVTQATPGERSAHHRLQSGSIQQCSGRSPPRKTGRDLAAPALLPTSLKSSTAGHSTETRRGLTSSDFGSVKVRTPCSMRAAILVVSMAGSKSNTRL